MRLFILAFLALSAGVASREDLRFRWSGEQGNDETCGLQALASLLSVYHGLAADEDSLVRGLGRDGGTPAEVSLADLLLLLRGRGFEAEAWAVGYPELCRLAALYAPILVHYARPRGHFALVLRADADGAVVADPAAGLCFVERDLFEWLWSGRVLLGAPGLPIDPSETARRLGLAVGEVEDRRRLGDLVARGQAGWRP